MSSAQYILVIKHGALGDLVIATAGFRAIRESFPAAQIILMTTQPFAQLMAQSPYFNEIWVDRKPRFFDRKGRRSLKTMLRSHPWEWVFDLQTSTRSTSYQWLFKRPWPKISNVSGFASHGYTEHERHSRHALDNLRHQLAMVGMDVQMPDVGWMDADISNLQPPADYALLVAGGAAHRPGKRWPAEQFASVAQELSRQGITPLLIGTEAESAALQSIVSRVPHAVNLCGKTSIPQLASLARGAALALGNDTGPMHVIAAANCPCTVLFSHESDPARSAPVGPMVAILREKNLAELSVDRVLANLTVRA